ncbi:hypothetical protein Landi51_07245 [Colletotrichum acutatum]
MESGDSGRRALSQVVVLRLSFRRRLLSFCAFSAVRDTYLTIRDRLQTAESRRRFVVEFLLLRHFSSLAFPVTENTNRHTEYTTNRPTDQPTNRPGDTFDDGGEQSGLHRGQVAGSTEESGCREPSANDEQRRQIKWYVAMLGELSFHCLQEILFAPGWCLLPSPVPKPSTIPVIHESERLVQLEAIPSSLFQHRSNGTAPVQATLRFPTPPVLLASLHRTPRLFIRHPSPNKRTRHLIISSQVRSSIFESHVDPHTFHSLAA